MFQTPFADRVRNEAGIATIAVGAISEADHVNSDHRGRPRRPVCGGAAAPGQSGMDAHRGRAHRLEAGELARAPYRSAKPQLEAALRPRARGTEDNA